MITFGWMVLSFERIIILIHPDLSRCGILIKLVRIISWKLGIFKFLQWFVVMSSICPHCAAFKVPAKMSVHVIRCRPGTTSKFHDFHESRCTIYYPFDASLGRYLPQKWLTNSGGWNTLIDSSPWCLAISILEESMLYHCIWFSWNWRNRSNFFEHQCHWVQGHSVWTTEMYFAIWETAGSNCGSFESVILTLPASRSSDWGSVLGKPAGSFHFWGCPRTKHVLFHVSPPFGGKMFKLGNCP